MYFNLFVFETISPNLDAITLMVQLSGVAATVVTLIAGTVSDKIGNRRTLISVGYLIWGVTVALFGLISPATLESLFGMEYEAAVKTALVTVIVGDCVMTLFGSTANDAAFSAWVTDNTTTDIRGRIESIVSILPLAAMLIVAGGFGIIVSIIGYTAMFISLGVVISAVGIFGIFYVKDSEQLVKNGTLSDIFYGFKPSSIKQNLPFYAVLILTGIYGIACQVFMPYLIIYMKTELSFSVIEYSIVFGFAILGGAVINLFLGKLSDKISKVKAMYVATGIFALGLFGMYLFNGMSKAATLILFGLAGFVMITGFIFISALSGALIRDNTPERDTGKLQGVRMIFGVLIPMLAGPAIGNAINSSLGNPLENGGADAMTTLHVPVKEIFLAAGVISLLIYAIIPLVDKATKIKQK
jgi:MFS family permease